MLPMNENWLRATLLLQRLVHLGCEYAIVSPGSRNAPLSHCASHTPGLKTVVEMDERNASFIALGIGKATHKPAILICTSGTAVANYFPAIVEAYYSRIPMIVLTADRPTRLQNRGAPQTIRQNAIFGSFAISDWSMAESSTEYDCDEILYISDQAYFQTTVGVSHAVHINCPFDEPLRPEAIESNRCQQLYQNYSQRLNNPPAILQGTLGLPKVDTVVEAINNAKYPVIVAGPDTAYETEDVSSILDFAQKITAPIVADITSGLRGHNGVIDYPAIVLREENTGLTSDCLIWLGGYPTSNPITGWMKKQNCVCFRIQSHNYTIDPDSMVTTMLIGSVTSTLQKIASQSTLKQHSNLWQSYDDSARKELANAIQTDLLPLHALAPSLAIQYSPPDTNFFLSNSMPIRYADWFSTGRKDVSMYANKGVNGIDGVIATAAGIALSTNKRSIVCIGDVAMYHNINALEFIARNNLPITIVLINDSGGGIFHYLPANRSMKKWDTATNSNFDTFEQVQGTPHQIDFSKICAGFGILHSVVNLSAQLKTELAKSTQSGSPTVLEVIGNRIETHKAVQTFFRTMKLQIDSE